MYITVVHYEGTEQYGVHKKEGCMWRREYALDLETYKDVGSVVWRDLLSDIRRTRTTDLVVVHNICSAISANPVPVDITLYDKQEPVALDSINETRVDGTPLPRSYRGQDWLIFSDQVLNHIETYTVPQYGDYPDDQLAKTWSVADCITAIAKYAGRYGRNSRGDAETDKDLVKIAHYACVALMKRRRHEPSGL